MGLKTRKVPPWPSASRIDDAGDATPLPSKKLRSKYRPEMCDTIIELGKRGRSKTQCAAAARHQPLDV